MRKLVGRGCGDVDLSAIPGLGRRLVWDPVAESLDGGAELRQ